MAVGVDGCRAGWVAVNLLEESVEVFPNMKALWAKWGRASPILVDVPIGLREQGSEERRCDLEARRVLGKRRSSVFPAPSRPALLAGNYTEACEVNAQHTGKRLSKQSYAIMPKILELDRFFDEVPEARGQVRETHPEVCFWALNGRMSMQHRKKSPEGFAERLALLKHHEPDCERLLHQVVASYPRSKFARDDVLDALAAAVTAKLGHLESLPEEPEWGARGLPMEMVFYAGATPSRC